MTTVFFYLFFGFAMCCSCALCCCWCCCCAVAAAAVAAAGFLHAWQNIAGGHYSLASPQFSTVCWHVSIINYGCPSPCWSLLMRQGSLRRASPKAGANAGGPARAAGWAADEHRLSHRAGLAGEMAGSSLAASKSGWGESGVS